MLVKRSASAQPVVEAFDANTARRELDAADPAVRRRAAQALRECAEAVDDLCRRLAVEPEGDVRAALLSNLIGQKSRHVADRLASIFDKGDAALRNEVMEALWEMPEDSLGKMRDMLASPDPKARLLAVNVLSEIPRPDAVELLEQALASEPDVNICLAAVDGLVHGDNFRIAGRLAQFAARFPDVEQAQFVVQSLLRSFGDPR
jgi:HEAT repeat protein